MFSMLLQQHLKFSFNGLCDQFSGTIAQQLSQQVCHLFFWL
jgi:hypothetical protein